MSKDEARAENGVVPLQRTGRALRSWPSPDWDFVHWSHRALKTGLEHPVKRVARLQWRGEANIPAGGAILAVNHFSWADPIVLSGVLSRPLFYIAKEQVFTSLVLGPLARATGQIKVDRREGGNEDALDTACGVLDQGLLLAIFPEGTRAREGEIKRGKSGVARIALASGAPVIPVGMTTDALWPKHLALPRFGRKVYINIGKPLRFEGGREAASDRALTRRVTDDVMDRIRDLVAEAEAARDRGESWRKAQRSGTP